MRNKKNKYNIIEGFNFTPNQRQVFDEIIMFFNQKGQDTPRFMLLTGHAGTGKSYLLGKCAEYLSKSKDIKILMCSPTNNATQNLKNKTVNRQNIKFSTIHSALGLKEEIDDDGNIVFNNNSIHDVRITDYNYVLLDEVSMVDHQLLSKINEGIDNTDIKILWSGDKAQVPPVNATESIIFIDDIQKAFNVKEVTLTQIIRQQNAPDIINLANDIRFGITDPHIMETLRKKYPNTNQLEFMDRNREQLFDIIKKYFVTRDFDTNANYCKIVAWRNDIVRKFNTTVRKIKYGEDAGQLVIGEKLIFDKSWTNGTRILFATNESVTVLDFTIKNIYTHNVSLKYYETIVSKEGYNLPEKTTIPILHKDSHKDFIKKKSELRKTALDLVKGTQESKQAWVLYYTFLRNFAEIKYNYAITTHKAQGREYNYVIVAEYDINDNHNVIERNRIKYTAITRAQTKVTIIM